MPSARLSAGLVLGQEFVVKRGVKVEVVQKSFPFFCCAPGPTEKPIDVRSQHRRGVIEAEDGIETYSFQFSLADDAPFAGMDANMLRVWKRGSKSWRIVKMPIRGKCGKGTDDTF